MAVALLVLAPVSPSAALQGSCSFQLGFASLHNLIPQVVGACLEDEYHDPLTGDALQQTTGGLLVWRKTDNWTAFTDGSQSWVNGPLGMQQRQNDQRFWWEANPDSLAIVPAPVPGDRCHTAGLTLELVGTDAGAGHIVGTFRFRNALDVDCTFFGYPGAQLLDAAFNPVETTVVQGIQFIANDPRPSTVDVPPHMAALFHIHWEQVPVGNETTCSMASNLAVTPPDEYVSLRVAIQIRACGGGHLDMGAVQRDSS